MSKQLRAFLVALLAAATALPLMVSPSGAQAVAQAPLGADAELELDVSGFQGFGAVSTTATRVLAGGRIMANLTAVGAPGYNAATLRVLTENAPGQPELVRRGMVGQSVPSETVPLKVWTPNFGPTEDPPDVDSDAYWKDPENAVWLYVFDENEPLPETVPPWDHPLFDHTDLFKWSNSPEADPSSRLPPTGTKFLRDPVPIYLALALEGKARPQHYQTTVYVEFAVSSDYGATFTTTTASVIISLDLADAAPEVQLDLDQAAFTGFQNVPAWSGRRLAGGSMTLSLSALGLYPYDAATLRVYTRNVPGDPSQVHLGMVGSLDRDWTVPLKVWTPNFAEPNTDTDGDGDPDMAFDEDGDGIPDVGNDTNWRDNEKAVWLYVFDWNQPIREEWWAKLPPEDPYYDPNHAWDKPLFDYTDLFKWSDYHDRRDGYGDYVYHLPQYLQLTDRRSDGGLDRRVPLYFAADFTDALPQTYATTVIVEFALSSDGGFTEALTRTQQFVISSTAPGDLSLVERRQGRSHRPARLQRLLHRA